MRRFVLLLLLVVAIALLWVRWTDRQDRYGRAPVPPASPPAHVEAPHLEGVGTSQPTTVPSGGEEGAAGSAGDPRRVFVRIVDARTGQPVAGAVLEVDDPYEEAPLFRSSPSEADGRVAVPRYEDWTAWWTVRRSGYLFAQHEVEQGSEPTEIRLEPALVLTGRVVDARAGEGLGGVRVHATWAGSQILADRDQVTDPQGRFEIAAVSPGRRVEMVVARDGYATVRCRSDGSPTLEVPLGAGAEVFGRVVDGTGRPVPDARVYVADRGAHSPLYEYAHGAPLDEMWPSRTVTNAGGRFSLRGVGAPSEVIVYATDLAGSLGKSKVLRVAKAEARVEVEVTVQPVGAVEISFLEAGTEREVKHRGSCSLAADDMPPDHWMHVRVDPDSGVARFDEMRAGAYTLRVESRDVYLAPPARSIEVLPGETLRVSVALERGRTATGRLVDGAGSPLRARMSFEVVWRGVRQRAWADSDREGLFTLKGIPPAPGTLTAAHYHFGDHSWPAVELEGELGDLAFPLPPALVGRLPAALADTPVFYGNLLGRIVGRLNPDESGHFRLNVLVASRPVTYFLRPEGGAALVLPPLLLAPDEVHDLGLLSFPDPVTITGRLLDARGAPLPGALVRTVERWCRERAHTDLEGRFRLPLLPPGRATLYLETAPATVAFHAIDVASEMEPLQIRLPAPGRLRCRVVREDGIGLASAPVEIVHHVEEDDAASRLRITRARTDSLGQLEVALYPGRYSVRPREHTGFQTSDVPTPIEIFSGAVVETVIRVRRVP